MPPARVVFDVGMHRGEDTAFYLSRGFRVVGVEANPALVAHLRNRFASELASGQLTIVDRAIARLPGPVPFAVNTASIWGTVDPGFARRNEQQGQSNAWIEVEAIRFEDVLAEFGIPYYVKVDIEGMDLACIEALSAFSDRPARLSLESAVSAPEFSAAAVVREISMLADLGYHRMAFVEQGHLERLDGRVLDREGPPCVYRYEANASGPFGDEIDARWRSVTGASGAAAVFAARHWLLGPLAGRRSLSRRIVGRVMRAVAPAMANHRWYDLHARLG